MKLKKIPLLIAFAAIIIPMFTSCKPTEKNYKQAYDIADSKRRKEAAEAVEMLGSNGVVEGAAKQVTVNGDSVPVLAARVKLYWPENFELKPCNVVIAEYRMPTNAKDQATRLASEGYSTCVLRNEENHYYVVIGSEPNMTLAAELRKNFMRKYKDMPYVGLGGEPIVVQIPVN